MSISSRDIGKNGAMPNRCAQYLRYENRGLAVGTITGREWADAAAMDMSMLSRKPLSAGGRSVSELSLRAVALPYMAEGVSAVYPSVVIQTIQKLLVDPSFGELCGHRRTRLFA